MDKLLRLALCFGLVAASLCGSGQSRADLRVMIDDGSTTKTGPMAPPRPAYGTFGKFNLSYRLIAGHLDEMPLLNCDKHPCTVYFPSGGFDRLSTDTFAFSDHCVDCTTGYARVIKAEPAGYDAGVLGVDGLEIKSLTKIGATLKFTYETTSPADMNPIFGSMTSGTFLATPQFSGSFTKLPPAGNDDLSKSCADASIPYPCSRLYLTVNQTLANFKGDGSIASVSIPCDDADSFGPCSGWSYGYYDKTSGSFNTDDPSDIPCTEDVCPQVHYTLLTSKFNVENQTLTLISSLSLLSLLSVENFGVENLAYAQAGVARPDPYYKDRNPWVAFSTAGKDPDFGPGLITLSSIETDKALPKKDQFRNDRSYVSYVARPTTLRWREVNHLSLQYAVVTGNSASGDPRLGNLNFSNCANNSFYIKVALRDAEDQDAGYLVIRLGTEQTQFSADCASVNWSETDFIHEKAPNRRVDAAKIKSGGDQKPMSVAESQSTKRYGDLYVRSISFVVDKGTPPTKANYKVRVLGATVGADHVTAQRLQIVDGTTAATKKK